MNNVYIAYALWFFLGWLGAHRLYLGKFISGFAMMALFFVGTWLSIFLVGYIFLAVWGIWWVMDVFFTGGYVEQNLKKENLIDELKFKDRADELKNLYELYEKGIITQEEFEKRKEILFN